MYYLRNGIFIYMRLPELILIIIRMLKIYFFLLKCTCVLVIIIIIHSQAGRAKDRMPELENIYS